MIFSFFSFNFLCLICCFYLLETMKSNCLWIPFMGPQVEGLLTKCYILLLLQMLQDILQGASLVASKIFNNDIAINPNLVTISKLIFAYVALHEVHLFNVLNMLSPNLGHWVKPRSTIWFSRFLLMELDDARWVENIHMTTYVCCSISQWFRTYHTKVKYKNRKDVHIGINVCCMIYKLVHSAKFVICNEFYAIGKLTISLVLHEFVYVVNVVHKDLIKWREGEITIVMEEFQTSYSFKLITWTSFVECNNIFVLHVLDEGHYLTMFLVQLSRFYLLHF